LGEKTIFVTHSPAHGVLDRAGSDFHVGSPSISKTVERHAIRAHIHGHIHKCFGREGIHFNVAAGGGFRAMVIELDDLSHEIVVRS
jgi:Icc-related predicted phosphoesterase